MWRAHLYIGIGLGGFFLVALLLPEPSDVSTGVIFATTIFAFHEYLEQRIRQILSFITSRYSLSSFLSPHFVYGLIAFIDLMIAVPMFGYSRYSDFFPIFLLIFFGYWKMSAFFLRESLQLKEKITNKSNYLRRIGLWIGILLLALVYAFTHFSQFVSLLEMAMAQSSETPLPDPSSPSSIPFFTVISALVIAISYLVASIYIIFPIVVLFLLLIWVILPPYALFLEPQLLGEGFEQMSPVLRLWAGVSILVVYVILSTPTLLSWVDQIWGRDRNEPISRRHGYSSGRRPSFRRVPPFRRRQRSRDSSHDDLPPTITDHSPASLTTRVRLWLKRKS